MKYYVYEEVINAKESSKEAFRRLIDNYEDFFCKKIEERYGKGYEKAAKELLPKLIKHYINSDIKTQIGRYLSIKAETCFNKRVNKIDLLQSNNAENEKIILIYYTEQLYECMKDCTTILTKEEKIKLAYDYLKSKMDLMKKEDINSSRMNNIIYNEKGYYKDEEKLLMRYVIVEGINDRILNYFVNKLLYFLDDYELTKEQYEKEIEKTLLNLEKLGYSFESQLKKQILKDGFNKKISKKEIITKEMINNQIRNLSKEKQDKIKEEYSYMKEDFFNKYKGICEDNKLKLLINEKYNDYFNAYINGTTTIYLSSYLNKRLTAYFDVIKKNYEFENDFTEEEKENNRLENEYLINTYLKKFSGYYPIKNDLEKIYVDVCNDYYKKKRTSTFYDFISYKLKNKLKELNDIYNDNYLNNLILKFKDVSIDNSLISGDIIDEVFENWIKYYLETNLYKQISLEEYMFNNLSDFDEEKTRQILNIKKIDMVKIYGKM